MIDENADEERRLLERINQGDIDALERVYDRYATLAYRQAYAILGVSQDAEDALQEVFLKLARRHGSAIKDLRAYLLVAARHESYTILRKRRRERVGQEADVALSDPPASGEAFGKNDFVRQALDRLPPEQREVVTLKIFEQLTFQEIGKIVRVSANTVASRYRYAMRKLREALGDSANA
jgi:RNA polymerase sigma-70 factor (ECF subfamily)